MFGDDDDFTPGASSNLAALFNNGRIESGNSTLTYTPPRQPRATGSPKSRVGTASTSGTQDLLFIKIVQCFKAERKVFELQGKAGAALVGNVNTKYYQILLYRDKNNHLCAARINKDFKFLLQPRNYASFYDKNKRVWSILFESEEDIISFSTEVALMRWNSEENPTLVVQDLWVPEVIKGKTADYGHYVQFTYTAYTLERNKLGKEQGDGSVKTAQVAKTGWEQGLFEAIKDMQRIIIIPHSQLGMWKSLVDTDTPVALKVTFTLVLTEKPEEIPAAGSDVHNLESSTNAEGNVKARGASITEALTSSPEAAKANLISRMAKMGQATLPFKGAVPTPSDSDETEEDQSAKVEGEVRTVPPPRPRVRTTNQVVSHTTSSVVTQPPAPWFPQNPYVVGGMMYPQMQVPVPDIQLPIFLSEVRTQNSELRMGITRVTDKIDNIMTKLNDLPQSNVQCTVLENVNRISEDNLLLQKEVESKLSAVQAQNEQLLKLLSDATSTLRKNDRSQVHSEKELEEVNQRTSLTESCEGHKETIAQLKQDNLELTQKYEEAGSRLKLLEEQIENMVQIRERDVRNSSEKGEEVEKLKTIIKTQSAHIESLKKEMDESVDQMTVINSLKERLIKYGEEVETLTVKLTQCNKLIDTLNKSIKEKHDEIQHLSAALDTKSTENQQLEDQLNKLQSQCISRLAVADEIKYVMNYVYRTLKGQFTSQESSYSYSDIHGILAETIKNTTVQYLQQSVISMGAPGVHHASPIKESHHVTSSPPPASGTRSPKTEYSKDTVVSTPQPVNRVQSPKIEYIKEPVVNTEYDETQSETAGRLHTAFGEYKNQQQRQEMEKEQLKKLSSQPSITSKSGVSENQTSDISVSSSDKAISSEGSIADKESCEDAGATPKVPEIDTKEIGASVKESDKSLQEEGSKQAANVIEITVPRMEMNDDTADDMWRPQPPPPPLFDEDENEDDWLNA